MQRFCLWLVMVMTIFVIAQPAYAQFPATLEAQQEFIRKKNEAAQQKIEQAKDGAKAQDKEPGKAADPRPVKDPRSVKDARPKKDSRSVKPVRATRPDTTKKSAAVCDIKVPRDCSEALSAANRRCSDRASSCKDRVSSTEDQSCVFIRCDVTRAECMKDALDDYIGCMDAGLEKAGAEQ